MRTVGVREFRDQATQLMGAGETLVIERHGEPIGFFVPVNAKDRRAGREVLGRLGTALEEIGSATGLDEEELVAAVAPSRRRR
jgi:antitoxin (DNA-binding transcriptional repressor) of toxin-antitoxin stability system